MNFVLSCQINLFSPNSTTTYFAFNAYTLNFFASLSTKKTGKLREKKKKKKRKYKVQYDTAEHLRSNDFR